MKSRYLAGTSLAVMGAGFLITLFLPQYLWVRLLQGGFEAGLVGGFADWFAVTALFRHPLGIPIPHTSLLLKNRDKIVNSLISALETELLNKDSITRRLRQVKLFEVVSSGIFRLIHRKSVRQQLMSAAISGVEQLPVHKISSLIQQGVVRYVQSRDISNLLRGVSREAVRHQLDEKALDYVLAFAGKWVKRPENEYMLGKLAYSKLDGLQLSGMKGFAVQAMLGFMSEEKLGSILKNLILSTISEISYSQSPFRQHILDGVRQQLAGLADNEAATENIKNWLGDKLEAEETEQWITRKLEEIKGKVLLKLEQERETGGGSIIKSFRWLSNLVKGKEETVARWEEGIMTLIVHAVEANYYRIGLLVRDNLEQLDDQSLVRMLEEKVGKDLQWIRVNGAICGFLIGLVLTVIHLAMNTIS